MGMERKKIKKGKEKEKEKGKGVGKKTHTEPPLSSIHGRLAWCSFNASDPISQVTVRRARLILQWVTACAQVNHLGM